MDTDLRHGARRETDCAVELAWKTESGEKRLESRRAINVSDTGVAIECPEAIPLLGHVIVRANAFEIAALAQVRHCTWRGANYQLGLHFVARTSTVVDDPTAPDHYEILRLSPMADSGTIERVYRTLMKRFHPDNEKTGEPESFCASPRLTGFSRTRGSASATTSSATYQKASSASICGPVNFWPDCAASRIAGWRRCVCCIGNGPPITNTRAFPCWISKGRAGLRGRNWAEDRTHYGITAAGVDYVENGLKDEHADLRMIPAVQIPRSEPNSSAIQL